MHQQGCLAAMDARRAYKCDNMLAVRKVYGLCQRFVAGIEGGKVYFVAVEHRKKNVGAGYEANNSGRRYIFSPIVADPIIIANKQADGNKQYHILDQ